MGKIKKIKPTKPILHQEPTSTHADAEIPQLVSIPTSATKLAKNKLNKNSDKLSFQKTPTVKKTISKKEKRATKHKSFLSKINLMKQQDKMAFSKKKQSPLKKKMSAKPVTGDLKPLKDALPSLDELFKFKSVNTVKTGVAEYDIPKTKSQVKKDNRQRRKRESLDRLKRFTELLKDPDYKKNPRETIANHIKFSLDLSDN